MQSRFKIIMILGASMIPAAAVAQTGEFVATVPGADVHRGYALQDDWQQVRNTSMPNASVRATRKPKLGNNDWHDEAGSRQK
jgi:hypothetical protein